jgi:ligand-binding sensor domain-containing protein
MRLRLTFGLVVLCLTATAASHRPRVYPNPTLNIFAIADGPGGLLWLATAKGLYRFDGLHYQRVSEFPFASARFVASTGDGSLWAADFPGLVRYRDGQFTHILDEPVSALAVHFNHVFASLPDGLARIALDGVVQRLGFRIRRDLSVDSAGKLWGICQWRPLTQACAVDPDRPGIETQTALPGGQEFEQAVRDGVGTIWAANGRRTVQVQAGRAGTTFERNASKHSNRASPMVAGRNGQVWFIGETTRGVAPGVVFRDRLAHERYGPLSGFEDGSGAVWIGTAGQGLVRWTIDSAWQRWFPEDFHNDAPAQIVREKSGAMVAATDRHLYRYDSASDKWVQITKQEHFFYSVLPLDRGEFLASIRDFGLARISASGTISERVPDLVPADPYREIMRDSRGRLWVGTKVGLRRIEGVPGSLRLRDEPLPGIRPGENGHAVDLELDEAGRLWAGYAEGIAWLDGQDHWHKLRTDRAVTLVRSFTVGPEDIWVAHRRPGAFSHLRKDGDQWRVTTLAAADGYGLPDSQYLKRDSRNWIWRGGSDGIRVSDGKRTGPDDWLHIDMPNGLAASESAQYGFFEDTDEAASE